MHSTQQVLSTLRELARRDEVLLKELITQVLCITKGDMDVLHIHVRAGDRRLIASHSHKMAGAACLLKHDRLVSHCHLLEQASHQAPLPVLAGLCQEVGDLIYQLEQALL